MPPAALPHPGAPELGPAGHRRGARPGRPAASGGASRRSAGVDGADGGLHGLSGRPRVAALHAHNSAFISERIFYPAPDTPKAFDAVHNARPAVQASRAGLRRPQSGADHLCRPARDGLGRRPGGQLPQPGVRQLLRGRGLPQPGGDQVRHVVNQARCGLVLSALEGRTTPRWNTSCAACRWSHAVARGREAMYDPRHVAVVEPTPAAVEAAVAAFVASAPDRRRSAAPRSPRRAARERLIAWLSDIVGQDCWARRTRTCGCRSSATSCGDLAGGAAPDGGLDARPIERWADWQPADQPPPPRYTAGSPPPATAQGGPADAVRPSRPYWDQSELAALRPSVSPSRTGVRLPSHRHAVEEKRARRKTRRDGGAQRPPSWRSAGSAPRRRS